MACLAISISPQMYINSGIQKEKMSGCFISYGYIFLSTHVLSFFGIYFPETTTKHQSNTKCSFTHVLFSWKCTLFTVFQQVNLLVFQDSQSNPDKKLEKKINGNIRRQPNNTFPFKNWTIQSNPDKKLERKRNGNIRQPNNTFPFENWTIRRDVGRKWDVWAPLEALSLAW